MQHEVPHYTTTEKIAKVPHVQANNYFAEDIEAVSCPVEENCANLDSASDPMDNNIGYGINNADSTPASKGCVCGRHRANAYCHNVILGLPFGRWAYTNDPDAVLDFNYTPMDFDYLAIDG